MSAREIDKRYVYSAACTWHGPISEVAVTKRQPMEINGRTVMAESLPCCPHCGSVLLEYPTRDKWDEQSRKFATENNMPHYAEWLETLRNGPCRPLKDWDWRSDYHAFVFVKKLGEGD